jgi:simple sugar transport system permease protein
VGKLDLRHRRRPRERPLHRDPHQPRQDRALYNVAQVSNGQSFVFNSIIAVVIGGTLLTGGYGSIVGIVLGTLTFAIVNQGIYYTGWNADWASLILGILLLAAVLMNNTFRKMALSYSPTAKKKA